MGEPFVKCRRPVGTPLQDSHVRADQHLHAAVFLVLRDDIDGGVVDHVADLVGEIRVGLLVLGV